MNAVNSLISDDHSNVNLDVFMNHQSVRYSGVVFSCINHEFKVVHSILDGIPVGSVVLKVNGNAVRRYVLERLHLLSKPTLAHSYRLKRTSMLLSIFNPYDTINSIGISTPNGIKRTIKLEYRTASRNVFNKRN